MLGRSALLAATRSKNYGNWLGNYSNVSLLLRGGTPQLILKDESPTPKTITAVGNATFTTAVAKWNQGSGGSSLAFDGNSYFNASGGFPSGTEDFTIEWWEKLSNTTTAFPLIRFDNQTNSGVRTGGGIQLVANGGNTNVFGLYTSTTEWQHIAIVRQSGVVRMYASGVNLVLQYNDFPGASFSVGSFGIGRAWSQYYLSNLNGYIDDLRITRGIARYATGTGVNNNQMVFAGTNNLALPTAELTANVINDSSYNSVSLLLRGGTPQLILQDESPAPKTITAVGNATFTTAVAKWNQGSGGSSLVFDGNGDYLSANDSAFAPGTDAFTVECWIRFAALPTTGNISGICGTLGAAPNALTSANSTSWWFGLQNESGTLKLIFAAHGPGSPNAKANWTPAIGVWYHIAAIRQTTGINLLFIDGNFQSVTQTSAAGWAANNFSQTNFGVGVITAPAYLNGYIDDLRITRGIVRYTSNFAPPPAELPNF